MMEKMPIDKRSSKAFWERQHQMASSLDIAWMWSADSLLRSFQILADQSLADTKAFMTEGIEEHQPFVASVAMMLGALAIENLLKAIAVSKNSHPLDERGKFSYQTHDLLKLAKEISISLDEEEKMLLERLEQFQSWGGRYPTALKSEDLRPRTLLSGGFSSRTTMSLPTDFDKIKKLVQKLKQKLPTVHPVLNERPQPASQA